MNPLRGESARQYHDSEATSVSLLARAKARDPEAWQRLVDVYGQLVYEWCRQTGVRAEEAADLCQDIFLQVSRKLIDFRRERPGDSFRGWLWTITRNRIRDYFRDRKGETEAQGGTAAQMRLAGIPEQPPDTSAPSSSGGGGLLEPRVLELARAGVEERTWQAFWRVVVEGRDAGEVAEELGISIRAVYDAKYRTRRKIRQELEGLLE